MPDDQKTPEQLLDDLVSKVTPKILESVSAKVEEQLKPLSENTQRLLDQHQKQKSEKNDLETLLAETQKVLDGSAAHMRERRDGTFDLSAAKNVQLKRSDARDPKAYRAAKAAAQERGVELQIVADD